MTVNRNTGVINVPQADLTPLGGGLYEIDINWLRIQLKAIEASEEGIVFDDTHRHTPEVTLGNLVFARVVELLTPIEFEDAQYTVRSFGANHNVADKKILNQVSLITENSAGLIKDSTGRGVIV